MTAMVTIITLIAVKYNGINTFRILESKKLKPSVKKKVKKININIYSTKKPIHLCSSRKN